MPKETHNEQWDKVPDAERPATHGHGNDQSRAMGLVAESISHLARELCEFRAQQKTEFEWLRSHHGLATLQDLKETGDKIMSAIGDWSAKVGPKLDRVQTGLDAVQDLVEKLQNSPGAITPEDQALLDQIESKVDAIAADADSVPATPPPV